MSKKNRNTFQKEVAQNATGYFGRFWDNDSKLLKTMNPYFAKESERWKRIKKK